LLLGIKSYQAEYGGKKSDSPQQGMLAAVLTSRHVVLPKRLRMSPCLPSRMRHDSPSLVPQGQADPRTFVEEDALRMPSLVRLTPCGYWETMAKRMKTVFKAFGEQDIPARSTT